MESIVPNGISITLDSEPITLVSGKDGVWGVVEWKTLLRIVDQITCDYDFAV